MLLPYLKKYTIVFIYVLLCCFATTTFSQENKETSIQIDTIAFKKTLESKSLRDLALTLYRKIEEDSVKANIVAKYIKNKYVLSGGTSKDIAAASITLSIWESKQKNTTEALSLINNGITISRNIKNDSILYLALLRKGNIYYYEGKYKTALDSYYPALAMAKKEKNKKREVFVKSNIALVRMQAKDRTGAVELFLEIIDEVKNEPSLVTTNQKLDIYLNLCGAYVSLEDFDAATIYCKKGASIKKDSMNLTDKIHFLSAFAEIARHNKEFEKSHQLLDEAEESIKKQVGHINLKLFLKLYRGKTYYDQEKYQLAVNELLKIEELQNNENHSEEILSIQKMYHYLAKSYNELGNKEEAIKYYDKAEELNEKNEKRRDELNTNLIKKYDLVELEGEIEGLEEESKYYLLGMFALGIVIVGLILFNRRQQRKNKQRFEALMNELEAKRQKGKVRVEVEQADTSAQPVKESEKVSKEKSVKIDPKMAEILTKLEEFEEKELFLSKDSTLVEVAKKIQTNTTYLSKVINTHKEKSFTSYITDLRVDYAIERLSHDRKFRSFTIGAIAQEIGFKRSESFSKAFKLKTGLYPSYFIKELEKQLNRDVE